MLFQRLRLLGDLKRRFLSDQDRLNPLVEGFRDLRKFCDRPLGRVRRVLHFRRKGGQRGGQGDGTFSVDMSKIKTAVSELDHDLLTVEAEGNYAGAKKMLDEPGVIRPALRKVLDSLREIPTDIEPIFVTADDLAPIAKAMPAAKPARRNRRRSK